MGLVGFVNGWRLDLVFFIVIYYICCGWCVLMLVLDLVVFGFVVMWLFWLFDFGVGFVCCVWVGYCLLFCMFITMYVGFWV